MIKTASTQTLKTLTPQADGLTLKPLLYLELLISSLMPVVAILLVGIVGVNQMMNANPLPFILTFLLCALASFCGECILMLFIQRAIKGQLLDLVSVCNDVIAGNKGRRAIALGDNELTTLVGAMNTLLDHLMSQLQAESQQAQPDAQHDTHAQQLFTELHPISQGDLRVEITQQTGNIGMIADICHTLLEELIKAIRMTRSASEQVMSTSRNLLSRAVELAQSSETHLADLACMTGTAEQVLALLQELDTTQQSQETEEAITLIKSLAQDLYASAQQLHLSGTELLHAAELTGAQITMAEAWKSATEHFLLPEQVISQ